MNVPNGFEDRSAYRIAKLVFNSICIFVIFNLYAFFPNFEIF